MVFAARSRPERTDFAQQRPLMRFVAWARRSFHEAGEAKRRQPRVVSQFATRAKIIHMLVEGSSLRSISRIADVSINTVTKLLIEAGTVAAAYHDQNVRGQRSKSGTQGSENPSGRIVTPGASRGDRIPFSA
jgi:DNA-binding CsgD family transcriptional regulator